MTNLTSSLAEKANAIDPGAVIKSFVQGPPPNAWKILAIGVFCLLAGTAVVTNTGERFSLDE